MLSQQLEEEETVSLGSKVEGGWEEGSTSVWIRWAASWAAAPEGPGLAGRPGGENAARLRVEVRNEVPFAAVPLGPGG